MTENQTLDNYETLIIYAGVMKYLTEKSDELAAFRTVHPYMTAEMEHVLFDLISNRIFMKEQKILGVCPVLEPYRRLHPLFYHLSRTADLYYTTEDTLITSNIEKQTHSKEYIAFQGRQQDKLVGQSGLKGKDAYTLESLYGGYIVREAEGNRKALTSGSLNEIDHRVLTNLTIVERKELFKSPARETIVAVHKLFNTRYATGLPLDRLETSSSPVKAVIAPLFNYQMSMEETLERAIRHTVDFSKEWDKLGKLEKRLRDNPKDKAASREYIDLRSKVGSNNPFRTLRKDFDVDIYLLEERIRKKASAEEIQAARNKVEEDMERYAAICESTAAASKKVGIVNYDQTAMFLLSEDTLTEGHQFRRPL